MTFYDWSPAYSSTSHCNCLRKSCHLSLWPLMVVEQTVQSRLCLISASIYQRCRKIVPAGVREWGRWSVRWGQWGGQGCFFECFIVGSANLKKFQTSLLAKLSFLSLEMTNFYGLELQYMFTLICIRERYLCASVIQWTVAQTTGSLTCLHDLLLC